MEPVAIGETNAIIPLHNNCHSSLSFNPFTPYNSNVEHLLVENLCYQENFATYVVFSSAGATPKICRVSLLGSMRMEEALRGLHRGFRRRNDELQQTEIFPCMQRTVQIAIA